MDQEKTEGAQAAAETRFLLMFRSEAGERLARIVIESLRAFGGPLRECSVWAFVLDPDRVSHALLGIEGIHFFLLSAEEVCPPYPFAEKVYAFAKAEEMARPDIHSLVWLSLDCLIINPPLLFDLGPSTGAAPADAAFRPVHHRNVGSLAHQPLDGYWQGVYRALEIDDMPYTVESFADRQTLRPYFNTHCFALNPALGLGRAWRAHFQEMVADQAFQAGPCSDALHQTFLHQAILSTLVAKLLPWERVRPLPPEYNYPLNLLGEMPPDRRATTLNSLVNPVYEDAFPWDRIEIEEPLRSWLLQRMLSGPEGAGS
jgi:hypothetical protein